MHPSVMHTGKPKTPIIPKITEKDLEKIKKQIQEEEATKKVVKEALEEHSKKVKEEEKIKKDSLSGIQKEIEERLVLGYVIKDKNPQFAKALSRISDYLWPSEIFSLIEKDVSSEEIHSLFMLQDERQQKLETLKQQEIELQKSLLKKPPIIGPLLSTIFKAFIPGKKGFEARQKLKDFLIKPADVILSVVWDNNRLRLLADLKRTRKLTEKGLIELEEKLKPLIEQSTQKIKEHLKKNGFESADQFMATLKNFEELVIKKEKTKEENAQIAAILEIMSNTYPGLIEIYVDFVNKRSRYITKYTGKILSKYGFNIYAKGYHV